MDAYEKEDLSLELRGAQHAIDEAYGKRLALILKGRSEGVSNREIGWSLGITEAAVRAIIKRSQAEETMNTPEWAALSDGAKALFVALTTTAKINKAGIIDWRPKHHPDLPIDRGYLPLHMGELEDAGLIICSPETEEIFVPSKIKFTLSAVGDYWPSTPFLKSFAEALAHKQDEQPELPLWKHRHVQQILEIARKG